MHHTGNEAVATWAALVGDVECMRCHVTASRLSGIVFRAPLVIVAVHTLEVELLDKVGVSGLSGIVDTVTSGNMKARLDPFGPDARFAFVLSLLEVLAELEALG